MKAPGPARGHHWYECAFGGDYVERYAHRDDGEAQLAVESLVAPLALASKARALDLCCGAGRHSVHLARLGFAVTSYDLSLPLLRFASDRFGREGAACTPVRGDMRELPFADASFALVASFFTSFGYFDDDAENHRVIAECARVLAPGGFFILDFLNRETTLAKIAAQNALGCGAEFRLHEAERVLEKSVTIGAGGGAPRTVVERLRLFSSEEIARMGTDAGFRVVERFGNYRRSVFDAQSSDRCITVFAKTASR